MGNIRVKTGKEYDVKIKCGLVDKIGKEISNFVDTGKSSLFIITDDNVKNFYSDRIEKNLKVFSIYPGENSKNFTTLSDILEKMAENHLTRQDYVIAFGGGVVGDISGFASGCYMRGIKYIQVPTTLLSMVDSSVGGKAAVDLKAGKNLAGLFHQPSLVLCDPDFLDTLPDEEYQCGIAEALKTGILSGEKLFGFFENENLNNKKNKKIIENVITGCIEYKSEIVHIDEKEKNERKLLNLGHTVGHSIEKISEYKIKHGIAVAEGIAIISRASVKLGWCNENTALRILNSLKKNDLPVNCNFNSKELARIAMLDKKRSGNSITLVIPSEIGKCELKEINPDDLEKTISLGLEEL